MVTVVSVFGRAASAAPSDGGGVGSGFVLNGDGEIATNAHVVTTGEVPDLREAAGSTWSSPTATRSRRRSRGYDPDADIALLEVDPGGPDAAPAAARRLERDVEVGTPVAAIGSPFGERQSLSVGVVSAVDRSITSLTAFQIAGAIQTDAAINPGNSGGPLVDGAGEVIGVNQQIRTSSGGGEGVGFAVPVDVVKRSLEQLRERRARSSTPTSASRPRRSTRSCASASTCPSARARGSRASTPDGPAEAAGMRGGGAARRASRRRASAPAAT